MGVSSFFPKNKKKSIPPLIQINYNILQEDFKHSLSPNYFFVFVCFAQTDSLIIGQKGKIT